MLQIFLIFKIWFLNHGMLKEKKFFKRKKTKQTQGQTKNYLLVPSQSRYLWMFSHKNEYININFD